MRPNETRSETFSSPCVNVIVISRREDNKLSIDISLIEALMHEQKQYDDRFRVGGDMLEYDSIADY